MPLPPQKEIELPLLFEIGEMGGQAKPQDLYPRVTAHFPQITNADLQEKISSGGNKWTNSIQWARQALVAKGEVDRTVRALWRITPKGKSRLASANVRPPRSYDFVYKGGRVVRTGVTGPVVVPPPPTPPDPVSRLQEQLKAIVEELAKMARKGEEKTARPTHDEVVEMVKEMGQMLNKTVDTKWGPVWKHDCVWKNSQWTNPSLVVEVCDKGNLDKDITSLNWAVSTWGAKATLVIFEESDLQGAQKKLLPGAQIYPLRVEDMVTLHSLLKAGNLQAIRCVFGV